MLAIQKNSELKFEPDKQLIQHLAEIALPLLCNNPQNHSFGIHFTTDEEMRSLNADYRGLDQTTDVLSFEAHTFDPEQNVTYLGDIIISVPKMKSQALQAEHSQATEMLLLITHGLLHLFGYDHATSQEKNEMWALQNQILEMAGHPPNRIIED